MGAVFGLTSYSLFYISQLISLCPIKNGALTCAAKSSNAEETSIFLLKQTTILPL